MKRTLERQRFGGPTSEQRGVIGHPATKISRNQRQCAHGRTRRLFGLSGNGELDRRKSYVQVTMRPREHDGGPDDFQNADETARWFLTDNPSDPNETGTHTGKFKQTFADSGTKLEISYDITPLPPQ